jgi:hypothetical protein
LTAFEGCAQSIGQTLSMQICLEDVQIQSSLIKLCPLAMISLLLLLGKWPLVEYKKGAFCVQEIRLAASEWREWPDNDFIVSLVSGKIDFVRRRTQ